MKNKLLAICALTASLNGCAYNLTGTEQQNTELRRRQDNVLDSYFTREAINTLREIPVSYAEFSEQWAIGCSYLNAFAAMWGGCGYEPITVYNIQKTNLSDAILVHEATHHAIRRGLIDGQEFDQALLQARETQDGLMLSRIINTQIAQTHSGVVHDEDALREEQLAFFAAAIIKPIVNFGQPLYVPEAIRNVYRRMLQEQTLSEHR